MIDCIVVIPTYNEALNVEDVVSSVIAVGYDVLIVDDNSPDGTGEIVDGLARESDRVAVLHRLAKLGLGPAYAAGFERALQQGSAIVCQMDADLSHDAQDLPGLVRAVSEGADLAIGSRYVSGGATSGWPWIRKAISRGGNWYAATLLSLPIRDATGGFRAWKADALRSVDPGSCDATGYGFQVEMAMRSHDAGLAIVEVPITFRDRRRGRSKMSPTIALEAMYKVTVWSLRRRFGRG